MVYIKSNNDKNFKLLNSLNQKKYRLLNNYFFDEGEKNILTSLKSNYKIKKLFVSEEYEKNHDLSLFKTDEIYIMKNSLFKKVSNQVTTQGIIAIYSFEEKNISEIKDDYVIVIDRVQDPGNMGTIIRSAHAFGINSIIYTKGTVDIFSPKVVRSSMGSIYFMDFYFLDDIRDLKEIGYKIYSTSLDTDNKMDKITFNKKSAIVLGNESRGVSKEILENSDELFKIYMRGDIDSLNVSVAGSIIIYEISKKI